ncbi:MAG: peptidoglycan DD-metalloendopeptidase family protein [Pirellulales bacterium]
MAGNLTLNSLAFVDVDNNPIPAPLAGEQIHLQVNWTATDVPLTESYRLQLTDSTAGVRSIVLNSNFFSGNGNGVFSRTLTFEGWYAAPGDRHVEVVIDSTSLVDEFNEGDNKVSLNYKAAEVTTLPQKFLQPLAGQQNVDWAVVNYTDLDPRVDDGVNPPEYRDYACDDGLLPARFKCGPVTEDQFSGLEIQLPNYASMDAGHAVYAVAGGVVTKRLDGFVMDGASAGDDAGTSIAALGDVNGDGLNDLLISAPGVDADPDNPEDEGAAYVVYGRPGGFPEGLSLADLLPDNFGDGSRGFILRGVDPFDNLGTVAVAAGDFNGDGRSDFAIGAPNAATNGTQAGAVYVIFGRDGNFPAEFPVSDLLAANGGDGTQGLVLIGESSSDQFGAAIANAGDLNGDGLTDLAIGAPRADGNGFFTFQVGRTYVVYGSTDPMPPQFNIAALFPTGVGGLGGFFINGESPFDAAGSALAGVHDVNGDGADDLLIGAPQAGVNSRGAAYIVYGHTATQEATDPFGVNLDLADLREANGGDATVGIVLDGADDFGNFGDVVAGLGDFDGDGLPDYAIGAPFADGLFANTGAAYIVYGDSGVTTPERQIDFLLPIFGGDGSQGFVVRGQNAGDQVGSAIAAIGDINGDGETDLAVGAPGFDVNGLAYGAVFVVFGSSVPLPATVDVNLLGKAGGSGGFRLTGPEAGSGVGRSLAAPGNLNGVGPDDFLIGAPQAGVGGQVFGVNGRTTPFRSELNLALVNAVDSVEVDHGNGWVTIYSHLEPSSIAVQPGDVIPLGSILGMVGTRGSDGARLLFQVEHNESPVETYLAPTTYWAQPLQYQGQSDRSVLDSGVTNLDPTADLLERPSDITRIHPTYQGSLYFWYDISHLNPNDEYQVIWYRPDGTPLREAYTCMFPKNVPLFNPFCNAIDASPVHMGVGLESLQQDWKKYVGQWQVILYVNGQARVRETFDVASSPIEPEIRMEYGPEAVGNPVLLSGRSTPIDFGVSAVGEPAPTQDFVIENHGSTALHLSNVVIPPGFRLTTPFPSIVNVDSRVRFTVAMDVDVPGDKFGEILFQTDDADESTYRFLVSGEVRGNLPVGSPVLDLPGPALAYQWLQPPQVIDDQARLADSNSSLFENGRLTVSFAAGGAAGDRLGIQDQGTGGGQISILGNSVLYSGVAMGTYSGGASGNPLVVVFNDQATAPAVEALVRSITYANVDEDAGTSSKYVRFQVTDDVGNVGNDQFKRIVPGPSNLNQPPSIASLITLPGQIIQPADITFQANGVIDPDGVVATVNFYVESNNLLGLQTGPGGDTLVGTDVNGVDGWSTTFSSSTIAPGSKTGYAVAQDNLLADSVPVSVGFTVLAPNQKPSIVFLSANPGQVVPPQVTTLTANGVADVDGFVTRVDFYRESNGVPGFQAGGGGDLLLGGDTSSAGGWTLNYSTNGLAEGLYVLYARATDNGGAFSDPVATQLQVGQPPPTGSVFYLSDLYPPVGNGTGGFVLLGDELGDQSGYTISSAGDINRDGFDDLLIGAPLADGGSPLRVDAGASYVVFGQSSGFSGSIDLGTLDGVNGFRILGANAGDMAGYVSAAGDVNGDGLGDLLIGAPGLDVGGTADMGAAYVVFGRTSGFGAQFDLSTINGVNGFRLDGIQGDDLTGLSVSGAGDFNGDGYADVLVGSRMADGVSPIRTDSGAAYLVFGKAAGFAASTDLAGLDSSTGVRIEGVNPVDFLGQSVRWAGDVNGDGLGDIILGAQEGQVGTTAARGAAFVIFGSQAPVVSPLLVDQLNGTNGFAIRGLNLDDLLGFSVSGLGDYNGDGFGDLVVGVPNADPGSTPRDNAGSAYVIFGAQGPFASQFDLTSLGGGNGFRVDGIRAGDALGISVGAAGDVNGDGYADALLGAFRASTGSPARAEAGETYVLFGSNVNTNPVFDLSSLNGLNGFRLEGVLPGDQSGWSVAGAGDVNGDGFDDLAIGAPAAGGGGTSYVFFGRDFTGTTTQAGGATADALTGSLLADILNGRQSNDELAGKGGVDVLIGGQGDDVLGIGDGNFRLLDGGRGLDTVRVDGAGVTIDLTGLSDYRMTGIERIDLRGTGDNTLILDLQEVLNLSDTSNQLIVYRNEGDAVDIGAGWSLASLATIDSATFYDFRQGSAQLLLQAVREGTPWQNPANPMDVNNNGGATPVTPLDALLIITLLNSGLLGNNPLPNPPTADFAPPPYGGSFFYDVNGDGYATPLDPLIVINFLNQGGGEGDGESPESNLAGTAASVPWTSTSSVPDATRRADDSPSATSPSISRPITSALWTDAAWLDDAEADAADELTEFTVAADSEPADDIFAAWP